MQIQSLSIVVPNKTCINKCPSCVSRMHCNDYANRMNNNSPDFDLALRDYLERLAFARDNGCNTVMLTGTSEPQQNRTFLTYFGMMQKMLPQPFRWVEMQTTGVLIDKDYLKFLHRHVGVNLISLSLFSLDGYTNAETIGSPSLYKMELNALCQAIKRNGFGLRLSLNLTRNFENYVTDPETLFAICKNMGADQVTLRVLYESNGDTDQDKWVRENALPLHMVLNFKSYVQNNGHKLGVLPHGAVKYSINGMSVVLDSDCMDKEEKSDENYKYLILREDCKLYSQWDDPASLIF